MSGNEKQIQDWQAQVRSTFGNESRLFEYLFETMDNFYYRYLETTLNQDLKTSEIAPGVWGALSFENSMVEALKTKGAAKPGIMELAKTVPRAKNPMVRYGLWAQVAELSPDHGELTITAEINWGFPEFEDEAKRLQKRVKFHYQELAQFRKELALKLEEAAEIFA